MRLSSGHRYLSYVIKKIRRKWSNKNSGTGLNEKHPELVFQIMVFQGQIKDFLKEGENFQKKKFGTLFFEKSSYETKIYVLNFRQRF